MPPHTPPVRGYLQRRDIRTSGTTVTCFRPIVLLRLGSINRNDGSLNFDPPHEFIFDSGSDITLIPRRFAEEKRILGYDRSAVTVQVVTRFGNSFSGCWGQVEIEVGRVRRRIPCFYYSTFSIDRTVDRSGVVGWFRNWLRRTLDSAKMKDEPLVLGQAGILGTDLNAILDIKAVGLSDQTFL